MSVVMGSKIAQCGLHERPSHADTPHARVCVQRKHLPDVLGTSVACSLPDTGETHDDAVEHGNMVAADAGCRRTFRPSADRGLISHGVQVAARDQPFVGDPQEPVSYTHLRAHETVLDL